jgi:sugar phosphate isomerase/epimerase
MKLSVTSWSFPACTLEEVVAIARALRIPAVDLGYFYRAALAKQELLADPEGVAQQVKALNVDVPCLYHLFGESIADRNLADPSSLASNQRDFARVLVFCRASAIPTVFVLPGVVNPGQSLDNALEQAAVALNVLVAMARDAGIALTIEPHIHSCLQSPVVVFRLLERVPGLKLTLDYAHFACLGYRQEEIDPLIPHAAHVHLRQARPGVLQAKMQEGTLDFPAMFAALRDGGFAGTMAIEYVHQSYMNTLHDDVLTETVAMRDAAFRWSGHA